MVNQKKQKINYRELLNGEQYKAGEMVIAPYDKQPWLVFNSCPAAVSILNTQFPIDKSLIPPQRTIKRLVYDCQRSRTMPEPYLIDIETIIETDPCFQRYENFIKQRGGQI